MGYPRLRTTQFSLALRGMAACESGGAWQRAHLLLDWPGLKAFSTESLPGETKQWKNGRMMELLNLYDNSYR